MNIGEVENAIGMGRGSIRFYEAEGLIKPERKKNGYRDYTEQDLEILSKIQLLRMLGVPIEEVKEVVKNEQPLSTVAKNNLVSLSKERKQNSISDKICKEIVLHGTDFNDLDARGYIDMMQQGLGDDFDSKVTDELNKDNSSIGWQRYFARGIDISIYLVVFNLVFHNWIFYEGESVILESIVASLVAAVFSFIAILLIEPIMLTLFGTTIGKFILRIRIMHKDERYLTYKESLKRTWLVLLHGMGLCIPYYDIYRNYCCYCKLEKGETQVWEDETDSVTEVMPLNLAIVIVVLMLFMGFAMADGELI